LFQTDVKEDAGLAAKWFEMFVLPDIQTHVKDNGTLVFEAYDKELIQADVIIGFTEPIFMEEIASSLEPVNHQLELFDKWGKLAGNVSVQT